MVSKVLKVFQYHLPEQLIGEVKKLFNIRLIISLGVFALPMEPELYQFLIIVSLLGNNINLCQLWSTCILCQLGIRLFLCFQDYTVNLENFFTTIRHCSSTLSLE